MRRTYIKNKSFLKNFSVISLIMLLITIVVISSVYSMSLRAIKQEVANMNENMTDEIKHRFEEVMEQCNMIASRLVINERMQLFFTHENPEYLIENFYGEIGSMLNAHGVSYIDSVIAYAPKVEKIFESGQSESYTISNIEQYNLQIDVSWIDELVRGERTTTTVITRAKNEQWPYYMTLIKQWTAGGIEGVIAVNVNLIELHAHLLADRDEKLELFVVDREGQIIMREDKRELYISAEEFPQLDPFITGESFVKIESVRKEAVAYAQAYSDKCEVTFVTLAPIGDYFMEITQMQIRFILIAFVAVVVALAFACIYSIKLVRPLTDIQDILSNPMEFGEDIQKNSEIREIADQIISHLQTNAQLRRELDSRLDLLKNTQMLALQAQINPHFMFNTLNTIGLMVESECGEEHPTAIMLSELSELLRYALSECENTSIREELAYVKRYINIMQYRYENFSVEINAEEKVQDNMIPKMILQPIIENALHHGISANLSMRPGMLSVKVKEIVYTYDEHECPSVCIDILDNGMGMEKSKLEELRSYIADHGEITREHIGLSNVAHRLYLLFHNEQKMILESTPGVGTHVQIIFPAISNRTD